MSTLKVNSIEGATGGEVDINATLGSIPSLVITGVTTVSAGTTSAPAITPSGDSNTGIFFPSADTIAFAEGGVEALRIDSSGNLGINTTTFPANGTNLKVSNGTISRLLLDKTGTNARSFSIGNGGTYLNVYDETADVERLRLDSSGRLGIGTDNPQHRLDCSSIGRFSGSTNSAVSGSGAEVGFDVANSLGFIQSYNRSSSAYLNTAVAGANVLFSISGTERARIDSSGNLGIGTTNPFSKLEMRYASSTAYSSTASPQTSNSLTIFNTDTTSTTTFSGIALGNRRNGNGAFVGIECVGTANDATALAFKTQSAGPVFAEVARFDSSGRLLIGTTTARGDFFNTSNRGPGFQVEGTTTNTSGVSVTANLNNDNGAELNFGKSRGTNTGSSTIVAANDTLGRISFQGADGSELVAAAYIQADVDGTPGANDMPGRLVFATTADGASSPTERFRIANSGRGSYFSSSSSGFGIACSPGASNTDNIFEGLHSATAVNTGTLSFLVRTNGNVLNTNSSYGALSDVKLKENIVDAASQWDDIKALRVRKYNFKEGQTHTQIGVIAQEVEQVSPGLVTESPDRDAEGNDLGTTTKAVQYSVLYMKAVKALQEAQVRIEQLESKVAALEAK